MMNGLDKVKQKPFILGFILLYVLPPIGMAWFVGCAILEWRSQISKKHALPTDLISLLLALMAIASIGSVLINWQVTDLLSTLILIGYLGIYMYWLRHPEHLHIRQFVWITIWGGVYIFFSEKVLNLIPHDSIVGTAVSFLTGHFLFGYRGMPRLYGSTFNPNYACYLLILALAFLSVELLRALQLKNKQLIVLSLLILPILDLGIYQTGSRAGFAIMFLIHLLFLYKLSIRAFIPVAALVMISAPFLYQWMPRSGGTESSMAKRIEIWGNSWHIFTENPFFGATTFGFGRDYAALNGEMIPHAHDLFLSVLSSSGIFCGLFFLAVIVINTFQLFKAQRMSAKTNYSAALFLFSLPTIILYGIMDFTLSSPQVMIMVLVLLSYWVRYSARMNQFARLHKTIKLVLGNRVHFGNRRRQKPAMLQTFKGASGR
ncbi:O-antigen ligase domain-containing protein [Sporolactobacillus sp. STSJ-5]|uniref:O-antigen ligase family protein n=1 Tax=Sporolactobacillus sp. STSJ-5 TaxID=2965076 RepID=UPI0021055586|nr:O-antigen ligase family protein [Sporolactobacillus sp. STSJ-5]MCQ2010877.1 O-antigen ligase domain-containing protein [Sporolactobacillus sp. STSJ-5]